MSKIVKNLLSICLIATSMFGLLSCDNKHKEMTEGTRVELSTSNYDQYLSVSYSCEDALKHGWFGEVVGYTVNFSVSSNKYLYYSNVSITLQHDVSLLNTDGVYVPQPTDYIEVSLTTGENGSGSRKILNKAEHRGSSQFRISNISGYVTKK